MTDPTQLGKIRNDILREMYSEAEPPLDFDNVLEHESEYPDDWPKYHYLPAHKKRDIFNKHTKDTDITVDEEARLSIHCLTRKGPTGSKIVRDRAHSPSQSE